MVTIMFWGTFEILRAIWNVHAFEWTAVNSRLRMQMSHDVEHLVLEVISVYAAFLIVVAISVWESSNVRWAMVGMLEDILPTATDYFAIGTIPLREWFEPNTQVYLATILRHQVQQHPQPGAGQNAGFRHERVLLFQSENDMRAVQASYLDEHFAKSFSAIHDRFDIPLGYLEPKDVRELVDSFGTQLPRPLLNYPWFARPQRMWWKLKLRGVPRLRPFVLIEADGQSRVLLFIKDGKTLTVEELTASEHVKVCKDIVDKIRAKIHDNTGRLKREFEFARFLRP
jgi:hypothetical protein